MCGKGEYILSVLDYLKFQIEGKQTPPPRASASQFHGWGERKHKDTHEQCSERDRDQWLTTLAEVRSPWGSFKRKKKRPGPIFRFYFIVQWWPKRADDSDEQSGLRIPKSSVSVSFP